MKKYLIVLDTNVLISAIIFGGKPRKIFELIIEGKVDLAISQHILKEVEEVLQRSKFGYTITAASSIVHEIVSISHLVFPKNKIQIVKCDPDDDRILECAVTAKADFIVSGDADLLDLGSFNKIAIMSPDQFLDEW